LEKVEKKLKQLFYKPMLVWMFKFYLKEALSPEISERIEFEFMLMAKEK
jgi:hypothetical protein